MTTEFWKKPLSELNQKEWEALCDGCARCCMNKLEDIDTGEVFFTNVACKLLEIEDCQCTDYVHRAERVSECLVLSRENIADHLDELPGTCAYKLRFLDKPLPGWHPLLAGTPGAVHIAGISMQNKALSEEYVHPEQLELHIIELEDEY